MKNLHQELLALYRVSENEFSPNPFLMRKKNVNNFHLDLHAISLITKNDTPFMDTSNAESNIKFINHWLNLQASIYLKECAG